MYLGYQNGKIKFYTEEMLNLNFYQLDKQEYTDKEYILNGDEYVLKDEAWDAEQAQKEKERIAQLKLTKREIFLAIYKDLKLTPEDIKSFISEPEALIEFGYANDYYRGNPLINQIGQKLGYSEEDLDYLFENICLPESIKEVEDNA